VTKSGRKVRQHGWVYEVMAMDEENALIKLLAGLIRLLDCTPMKRGPWTDRARKCPATADLRIGT
jgi:putative component of membrane protein insertase Oxa1/YidC/SpoIIIJ protein YidD